MITFPHCVRFRLSVTTSIRFYTQNKNSNLVNLLKTMPKDPKHISEAQKIRKKIKEKSSRYVPGRVTLQVLGTGAEGAPRSLYVFSDQSRFLRQLHMHYIKMLTYK